MPFNLTFASAAEIPDDLKGAEKQEGDKFIVSVVPNKKLEEFRETNIKVVKERDSALEEKKRITTLLGTEDIEEFTKTLPELRDAHQKVKDKTFVEAKGLNVAIEERTREMKESFEKQLKDAGDVRKNVETDRDNYKNKYRRLSISNAISAALMEGKSGLRTDALPVIMDQAFNTFRVTDEEKVVPYQGDAILYGADGSTPMTPTEWLKKLGEQMPFLLKESQGGGGGGGSGTGSGVDTSKMTPQQKMQYARQNGQRR